MPACDVDLLARNLGLMAAAGRSMPPAYLGAEISQPVLGPDGQRIGRMLPGRGLLLDHDLAHLGINRRRVRNVFGRSEFSRFRDFLGDDRAAITTIDGIVAARAGGKAVDTCFSKLSYTTVANVWSSSFRAGGIPTTGTYTNIPTGAAHDRNSVGALSNAITDTAGSDKRYLLSFGFTASQQINVALLVDLLVCCGNILATTLSPQTVSSTALTRYTTGAGVCAIFDVTSAIGTTASNINLSSYTNQAGTAAQVSPAQAMTVSAIVQRLMAATAGPFVPLASGDYGVRAVSTVTLSAAMTLGVMALNLYYPLMWVPGVAANIWASNNSTSQIDGLCELPVVSNVSGCLALYMLTNTTSTGILTGAFQTCSG